MEMNLLIAYIGIAVMVGLSGIHFPVLFNFFSSLNGALL